MKAALFGCGTRDTVARLRRLSIWVLTALPALAFGTQLLAAASPSCAAMIGNEPRSSPRRLIAFFRNTPHSVTLPGSGLVTSPNTSSLSVKRPTIATTLTAPILLALTAWQYGSPTC